MSQDGQNSSLPEETPLSDAARSDQSNPLNDAGNSIQSGSTRAVAKTPASSAAGKTPAGNAPKPSDAFNIWRPLGPVTATGGQPDGGARPDPAKVAEDAALVKACTSVVESFRQDRITKADAVTELVRQFALYKRHISSGIAPYQEQLDQHERACAEAAAAGAARDADAKSGLRDQLASQGAQSAKRTRAAAVDDSDDDADADPRPTKRGGYDPDTAAFRTAIRPRVVSEINQRTLDAQINYLGDLKRAKRDLLSTGCAPAFPLELWDDILANRAVDFDKILSAMFSHIIVDTTEHRLGGADGPILHLPNTRPRKRVGDFADWLLCCGKWSDAVCFAFPWRRPELLVYNEFFADIFNSMHKSHHGRVIQADTAIRNAAASDASISLCDKERLHFLAMRHISPWGAETGPARADSSHRGSPGSGSRPGRPTGQSRPGSSGEICRNWNRGTCAASDNCRHIHRCNKSGCNASHPATDHDSSTGETTQGGSGGQRSAGQRK